MTAHHRIACQDLHLTDRGDSGQPHSAQTLDSRVVEDHAFVGRRRETQSVDFVVGGELQTVDAIGERDRGAIVLTEESLTRSEADGRSILQLAIYDDRWAPASRRRRHNVLRAARHGFAQAPCTWGVDAAGAAQPITHVRNAQYKRLHPPQRRKEKCITQWLRVQHERSRDLTGHPTVNRPRCK